MWDITRAGSRCGGGGEDTRAQQPGCGSDHILISPGATQHQAIRWVGTFSRAQKLIYRLRFPVAPKLLFVFMENIDQSLCSCLS